MRIFHPRLRVSLDMLLAPFVAILLLGGLAWLGGTGLSQVVGQADQIANVNLEASVRIARIANKVQAINALLYHTMTQRAAGAGQAPTEAGIDNLALQVDEVVAEMGAYRDSYAPASRRPAIDEVLGELKNYRDALRWVASMLEIDFTSAVSFIRPFDTLFDHLNQLIAEMTADLQQDARSRATEAARHAQTTGRWFLLLTAVFAAGTVLASWTTGRHQMQLRVNSQALEAQVAARTAELMIAKEQAESALVEVRAAQRQLIEAEKMAALGSLVAGIAHEVNTPVGSALTAASVLEEKTSAMRLMFDGNSLKKADFARYLDSASEATMLILSNIRRAAELVRSFKQVAADQTSGVKRRFAVRTCLEELLVSLRPRLKRTHIRVQVDCREDLAITGYPGALSQVVTNLVMNSLTHAFAEGAEGVITIAASETGDGRLNLTYEDDGCGIPEAVLPKIFDPFFTTRRGLGGTGLGLHIVYNNVTQNLGGTISVTSQEGGGTRFVLDLPCETPSEVVHQEA